MNWEIVGAAGEWAGALLVAITLIHLSVQIRLQNRISEYEAWASIIDGFNQHFNSDPESALAYLKGRKNPDDCDDAELMLFRGELRIYANNTQKAHRAYRSGFLPKDDWIPIARVFAAEINTPGGTLFRKGNESYMPDFYTAVDEAGGEMTAEMDLRAV